MISTQALIHKLNQAGPLNSSNRTNIGTAGSGVTAQEYGNNYQHTTILSINKPSAFTLGDGESLADGHLIYTLPAGALYVNNAYMALQVSNAEHTANAIAELGLGTSEGAGAVALLSEDAGFENILTGLTYSINTVGISQDICNSTGGTGGLRIGSGNPHTVYANISSVWADTDGLVLGADLQGFVILNWTFFI